jgi:hypothetical protein
VSDLSLADKYTDAFWRVVPIPVALVAALIAVVAHPSGVAIAALVLVGVVGFLVELTVWRDLKRRWSTGVPQESVGRLFEEPTWPATLTLCGVLLWVAFTSKVHRTEGGSWGDAAIFGLVGLAVYAGLIAFVSLVMHGFGHRD